MSDATKAPDSGYAISMATRRPTGAMGTLAELVRLFVGSEHAELTPEQGRVLQQLIAEIQALELRQGS